MGKTRKKFIVGLGIGAGVAIASTVLTILNNETLTPGEQATQSVVWSFVFCFLAAGIYAIIEIYYQVTKPKPLVEVLEDEDALKKRYEDMRRTEGVIRVQAIWAARYMDVDSYFRTEGRDLERDPTLEVERLVNPNVIGSKYRQQFTEFVRDHPNLTVWATDVSEFECYICEYLKGGSSRLKALLVLNDTVSGEPQLGIFIDPEKSTELKPLVHALRSWFLRIPRQSFPGTEATVNIWEVNAPSYDDFVTSTDYPFLRNFLDKEQQFLEETVGDIVRGGNDVSIVEVGSGTGRTLFNLAKKPELMSKVVYLIGVDSSRQMTLMARSKRETILSPSEAAGKLFFFNLDGAKLSQYFSQGKIMTKRLRRDAGEGESLGKLHEKAYGKSRKIICTLLNTVGIMEQGTRVEVIRNMVAAASRSDLLIFSVLSSASFSNYAPELYSVIRQLVGGFDSTAFHHESCEFKTDKYYSQWFDKQSFCATLLGEGCSNLNVKSVDDSGYFITCSPSS